MLAIDIIIDNTAKALACGFIDSVIYPLAREKLMDWCNFNIVFPFVSADEILEVQHPKGSSKAIETLKVKGFCNFG